MAVANGVAQGIPVAADDQYSGGLQVEPEPDSGGLPFVPQGKQVQPEPHSGGLPFETQGKQVQPPPDSGGRLRISGSTLRDSGQASTARTESDYRNGGTYRNGTTACHLASLLLTMNQKLAR